MNLLAIVIANSIGIFLSLSVLNISYMDRRSHDPDSKLLTALLVISCSCCLGLAAASSANAETLSKSSRASARMMLR